MKTCLNVVLNSQEKEAYRKFCEANGSTPSQWTRKLIRDSMFQTQTTNTVR